MVRMSLDNLIREFMVEVGDGNENKYARYLQHAISGLREFNFDLQSNTNAVSAVILPVSNLLTCDLPRDYINYIRIGILDQLGNFHGLGLNRDMRMATPVDNCGNPTIPTTVTQSAADQVAGNAFGLGLFNWDGPADNIRNGELTGRFFGIGGGTNPYGYYRINLKTNKIELGGVIQGTIFLEYLADLDLIDGEFFVHPYCVEALKCYIYWKMNLRNDRKSGVEKQTSRQEYFNEFARAKARFNAFRMDELMDAFRWVNKAAPRF